MLVLQAIAEGKIHAVVIPNPGFLLTISSIHKQIAYGDYVFTSRFAEEDKIYNAFIIPFKAEPDDDILKFVSIGTGDWITYDKNTANYK